MVVLPLLIFVVARRWLPLLFAAALPLAVNAVGLLSIPDPADYFCYGIPRLFAAWPEYRRVKLALGGLFQNLRLPALAASALGMISLAAVIWLSWRRWRHGGAFVVAETTGLLARGTVLAAQMSWDHYLLLAVPLFVSFLHPASRPRSPIVTIILSVVAVAGSPVLGLNPWLSGAVTVLLVYLVARVGIRPSSVESPPVADATTDAHRPELEPIVV